MPTLRPARPLLIVPVILMMAACGDPPKKAEGERPPEPVTGLHALFQMFGTARSWAPDVQVLQMTSLHLAGVPTRPGKAAGWTATFVSPSLNQARVYTFSVVDASMTRRAPGVPVRPTVHSW
jgi:hypothetical protein